MHNVYDTDAFIAWPLAEFLATWWLQASILLAIGLLATFVLRRPVYQATVYRACLVAVLLCPALALAVNWTGAAVLTLDLRQRFMPAEAAVPVPSIGSAIVAPRTLPLDLTFNSAEGANSDFTFVLPGEQQLPPTTVTQSPSPIAPATSDVLAATDARTVVLELANDTAGPSWFFWLWLVMAVWMIGALAFLVHLAFDLRYARWLIKRSVAADAMRAECCQHLAASSARALQRS